MYGATQPLFYKFVIYRHSFFFLNVLSQMSYLILSQMSYLNSKHYLNSAKIPS